MTASGLSVNVPEEVLDALADAVAARVVDRLREHLAAEDDGWMATREAAAYLGISVNTLHKLTAGRQIPFEQASRGARCYFKRAALDVWRAS